AMRCRDSYDAHVSILELDLNSLSFSITHCHHPALHSFPTRRSSDLQAAAVDGIVGQSLVLEVAARLVVGDAERAAGQTVDAVGRSEEHTSELQSPDHLVCRLLLEKKKTSTATNSSHLEIDGL